MAWAIHHGSAATVTALLQAGAKAEVELEKGRAVPQMAHLKRTNNLDAWDPPLHLAVKAGLSSEVNNTAYLIR